MHYNPVYDNAQEFKPHVGAAFACDHTPKDSWGCSGADQQAEEGPGGQLILAGTPIRCTWHALEQSCWPEEEILLSPMKIESERGR